jgi:excisionase family DNA binding protein
MTETFLTKRDIATHLKVSTRTIDEWMASGVLPFVKLRGTVRFSPHLLQNIADSISTVIVSPAPDNREHL